MSIQRVFDNASSIQIDRSKLAGHTLSRSGRIKTLSVASAVPWRFTVSLPDGLRYSENRDFLEELDRLDRIIPEEINIGLSNPRLSYITRYRGDLTNAQLADCDVVSVTESNIRIEVGHITNLTAQGLLFRAGDFIQPAASGYKYAYTVREDAIRGAGGITQRNIPIHRPFIPQAGVNPAGSAIKVGQFCTFNLLMLKKPSYSVVPRDRIAWSGDFEFIEVVE